MVSQRASVVAFFKGTFQAFKLMESTVLRDLKYIFKLDGVILKFS